MTDFGNQHLDQDLRDGFVEFVDHLLDAIHVLGVRRDNQGIGVGLGDDGNLSGQFPGGSPADCDRPDDPPPE